MGRPSFRGVILRDHGTERPEGLPTMGTAPKTQKLKRCKKKAMTPKGLFRRFAHPLGRNKAGQQDRQDRAYTIPYKIAKQGAHHRRHPPNTETCKGWFPGAAAGRRSDTGPHCLKSLVICDSRFESQIAIAIKSRDLEHLEPESSKTHGCPFQRLEVTQSTKSRAHIWADPLWL